MSSQTVVATGGTQDLGFGYPCDTGDMTQVQALWDFAAREIGELAPADRSRMMKALNFVGDHVDTTAPRLVERMIGDNGQGAAKAWLTTGWMVRRAFGMMAGRRDVLSRYGLEV